MTLEPRTRTATLRDHIVRLLDRRKRERKPARAPLIELGEPGSTRRAHATWWRGEATNHHPDRAALARDDAIDAFIGHGWFPAAPFITRDDYITAFGSCFASEVTKYLHRTGYRVFGRDLGLDSYVVRCGEGIVNTSAVRQQFEWAFENRQPEIELWHDKAGVPGEYSEEIRRRTREIFDRSDVFILTLGLSEVWYDKPTGEVFWRAIPSRHFDPSRHGFRVMGPEENLENLRRTHALIRRHRPEATVIFTLSPVPLAATFRPVSCITANSVSKASLRVAIDELMREAANDARLFYFPSYEIVTAFAPDPMKDDLRHPREEVVALIMETFRRRFLI